MGFIRANVVPILREHRRRPLSGSLLCFGVPDVYFSEGSLNAMAKTIGVELSVPIEKRPAVNEALRDRGYISGHTLFASLGVSDMTSLDVSTFEGAEIEYDLNSAQLPEALRERFDVVIDHGTMEHVFHIPNVLKNAFELLGVGGRMIHSAPTSNLVDHGFYMFSPTFFHDYYTANAWEINSIYVISMSPNQETEPFFYTEYEPGSFDAVAYGGLGAGMYFTLCIVTKTAESSFDVIPQQGFYRNKADWKGNETPAAATPATPATGHLLSRVRDKIFGR